MHNIWLIARREYLERIHTRSFTVMTVLIPVLMLGSLFGYALTKGDMVESVSIAIVAPAAAEPFADDLRTELEQGKRPIGVSLISPPTEETRSQLDAQLADKDLDGYLWITAPEQANGHPTFVYTPRSKSKSDATTGNTISQAIRTVLTREGLMQHGMTADDAAKLIQPVNLNDSQAARADHSEAARASAAVLFFLMYFVILLYGMNVARSIIEEKTSRIFEVMLATIRPEEMLAGKMIGVGSVGLTQVAIWLAVAILLSMTSLVERIAGTDVHLSLGGAQTTFFVVFFLLGYLLYSSMAAALGAMTNSEQELQQLNMFLALPLASSMVLFGFVLTNPDGILPRIFSLVPFTSPLIMYMRICIKIPPIYEIAASLLILIASILAILWVASRIYRVGILMYGKRPSLAEIMRWLKYS